MPRRLQVQQLFVVRIACCCTDRVPLSSTPQTIRSWIINYLSDNNASQLLLQASVTGRRGCGCRWYHSVCTPYSQTSYLSVSRTRCRSRRSYGRHGNT